MESRFDSQNPKHQFFILNAKKHLSKMTLYAEHVYGLGVKDAEECIDKAIWKKMWPYVDRMNTEKEADFVNFLKWALHKTCLDYIRSSAGRLYATEVVTENTFLVEPPDIVRKIIVEKALKTLEPIERKMVVEVLMKGTKFKDAVVMCGVGKTTGWKILTRAKSKLKEELGDFNPKLKEEGC